jgi:thiosulfate/3-mercaptopyruvate sulfurtransferase
MFFHAQHVESLFHMEELMNRTVIAFFVISALLTVGAGVSHAQSHPASQMLVETEWLANHLNDKSLVVLHVGINRQSYDAGHVPGARFLAISEIAVTRNGIPNELPSVIDLKAAFERLGVGDKSRVVLYGDESGLLAARTYFTLDYLGHGKGAAILDGGLEKWKAEKRSLTTAPAEIRTVTFTPKSRPEVIIELPAVVRMVEDGKATLIDARPPNDFSGVNRSDGIKRGGHIPGAKNVFWVDNLVSRENPVLKPAADIRASYEAAGVKPGSKVVVYCRSGVQAAHDYFTLKLLGFTPVLYDGSFIEWSNNAATKVDTGK